VLLTPPAGGRTLGIHPTFEGLKMAMKACPICRMEQSDENQSCQACGATFDDSPQGATAVEPEPEEESEEETEEAE
jgi:RNA polymerase subunit RPABC4/transcription elongation factor Spt4